MIRPNLEAIAAKWIKALRLGSFEIDVRYARNLANRHGDPVFGLMSVPNDDAGRFVIRVQDPETWPDDPSKPMSAAAVEEIVIHELSHVRLWDATGDTTDPSKIKAEERAVWAFAAALQSASAGQRAAMVRAMAAAPGLAKKVESMAAPRRNERAMSMDAKQVLAAIKEQDEAAALQILEQWLAEQIGGAGGPGSEPMPANPDDGKDKPPMGMSGGGGQDDQRQPMPARAAQAAAGKVSAFEARAMRATQIIEDEAKRSLIRAMRTDGIELTPAAEKRIIGASTLEEAEQRAALVRDMAPPADDKGERAAVAGKRSGAKPPTNQGGHDPSKLNESQKRNYARYMRQGREDLAEQLYARSVAANAKAAKAGG